MRHSYDNVTNIVLTSEDGRGLVLSFDQEDSQEDGYAKTGRAPKAEYYENQHGDLLAFYTNQEDSGPISVWSHSDLAWIGWDSYGYPGTRDYIRSNARRCSPENINVPLDR